MQGHQNSLVHNTGFMALKAIEDLPSLLLRCKDELCSVVNRELMLAFQWTDFWGRA